MDLKEAIKILIKDESIGDFIYAVRERAAQDSANPYNTWDHPRVINYGLAIERLKQELNELTNSKK